MRPDEIFDELIREFRRRGNELRQASILEKEGSNLQGRYEAMSYTYHKAADMVAEERGHLDD